MSDYTDTVPAPVPDAVPRRRKRPFLGGMLVGFVVGAAVASGVFLLLMDLMRQRHAAELAAVGIRIDPAGLVDMALGKRGPNNSPAKDKDETKVLEIGKAFVADLENNRLASAYRTMTATYQMQTPRKTFDEMVGQFPGVRRLNSNEYMRDYKARKSAAGKGYEFYCTAHDTSAAIGSDRVNFALLLIEENGDWRVNELEITAEKKP